MSTTRRRYLRGIGGGPGLLLCGSALLAGAGCLDRGPENGDGSDESGALVFLPSDGEFPAEPGCWRLTDGVAVTEEYRTFEIDAGASSSRSVDLYGTPGEDACLPVGEYRFETAVSIGRPDSEPGPSGRWSLTVLLE